MQADESNRWKPRRIVAVILIAAIPVVVAAASALYVFDVNIPLVDDDRFADFAVAATALGTILLAIGTWRSIVGSGELLKLQAETLGVQREQVAALVARNELLMERQSADLQERERRFNRYLPDSYQWARRRLIVMWYAAKDAGTMPEARLRLNGDVIVGLTVGGVPAQRPDFSPTTRFSDRQAQTIAGDSQFPQPINSAELLLVANDTGEVRFAIVELAVDAAGQQPVTNADWLTEAPDNFPTGEFRTLPQN